MSLNIHIIYIGEVFAGMWGGVGGGKRQQDKRDIRDDSHND